MSRSQTAYVAYARAHNPRGVLDSTTVTRDSAGRPAVLLSGWAYDPDAPATRLRIAVRIDTGGLAYSATGVARPDVARAFSVGPATGYRFVRAVPPGLHTLCVYAANVGTGTLSPRIGCRAVTVR